jgi:hypothetical protein
MTYQIIDPNTQNGKGCSTCCCTELSGRPGETSPLTLDYAVWSVPIGGRGLSETAIDIEKIHSPAAPNGVSVAPASGTTPFNTPLVGTVATAVTNPDALPLQYSLLPFDETAHGSLLLDANTGAFTYTPKTGFAGYDRFFFEVAQENSKAVVGEFVIGVVPQVGVLPAVRFTPDVQVPGSRVVVNRTMATVRLGIAISPAAPIGAVYRMTVKQTTLDCDCMTYSHISCYDLVIGKC